MWQSMCLWPKVVKTQRCQLCFSLRPPGQAGGSETRLTETEGNIYVNSGELEQLSLQACNLSTSGKWKGQSEWQGLRQPAFLLWFFSKTIIQKKHLQETVVVTEMHRPKLQIKYQPELAASKGHCISESKHTQQGLKGGSSTHPLGLSRYKRNIQKNLLQWKWTAIYHL